MGLCEIGVLVIIYDAFLLKSVNKSLWATNLHEFHVQVRTMGLLGPQAKKSLKIVVFPLKTPFVTTICLNMTC